ncbi:MAG: type II toxin-antitoxin system YhaV family toxin [Rhodospirillales bacterium]|nr:type II toxin-antitoxin system YhaV family toxin [Rhodospirillales bacterium]MDH3911500.1 type II toxin-antitoxin system YhaV family toxin [Rhodospirillales bacterium]MDH3918188.1 type II toxin-antitoxin system YhaV family toxin [Rhodospirillales bacterium]MDH3968828.1 type II toxin-antitoxin system YhaV family toxin [Rhodospirillales bacterium]
MRANGWDLYFHPLLIGQLQKLADAFSRAKRKDPDGYGSNANVKLLAAVSRLLLATVPLDPAAPQYRQGKTLGGGYTHWFRAKFGGRFRLFFRYDSRSKIIVYAWMNDESGQRKAGDKGDPYAVFKKMLDNDNPPDGWAELLKACESLPEDLHRIFRGDG